MLKRGGINLKRSILAIGIIFLFIGMSITPSTAIDTVKKSSIPTSNGNTLYVGGSGEGNYTSIQDAIENASDGDTVFVYDYSSPYYENVVVNKSINLIGEDRDTTVIDAEGIGSVIIIQSDSVKISGFKLINCGRTNYAWEDNVITVIKFDNIVIEDNLISTGFYKTNCVAGIYLVGSSNNLIKNNIIFLEDIQDVNHGISLDYGSDFNNVSSNEIYGYFRGLWIMAEDNTVYGNYIYNNWDGIEIKRNKNNIINNKIKYNKFKGIRINKADNNLISGNIISNNGDTNDEYHSGIKIDIGKNNQVKNNIISNNKGYGIFVDFGYNNIISRNNFVSNPTNTYFDNNYPWKHKNLWNENYWNRPRILPYIIIGRGYVGGGFFTSPFSFPWINIDWNPAKEPYDIPDTNIIQECGIE